EEPHRRSMTTYHAQERVGLSDHVVRGDQRVHPREQRVQRPDGPAVPLIVGHLHRKPGTGIDEDTARLDPSARPTSAPHGPGSDRDRAPRDAPPPCRLARSSPPGARPARTPAETTGPPRGARRWT